MQKIQEFASDVKEAFIKIGANVDGAVTATTSIAESASGIALDVQSLKDKLNSISDTLSPEDAQVLDDVKALANGMADKTAVLKTGADDLATQLKALDDATTPEATPTPTA